MTPPQKKQTNNQNKTKTPPHHRFPNNSVQYEAWREPKLLRLGWHGDWVVGEGGQPQVWVSLCNRTSLEIKWKNKLKKQRPSWLLLLRLVAGHLSPLSSCKVLLHCCFCPGRDREWVHLAQKHNQCLMTMFWLLWLAILAHLSQRLGSEAWVSLCRISTKPISLSLSWRSWEPVAEECGVFL